MAKQSGARTVCEFLMTLKDGTEVSQRHIEGRFPKLTYSTIGSALADLTLNGGLRRMRPSHYKVDAEQLARIHAGRGWKSVSETRTATKATTRTNKTDADILLDLVTAMYNAGPVLKKYHELAVAFEKMNK